jgi:hypothetical protein
LLFSALRRFEMSKKMIVNGFRGLVTTSLVALLVACGGGGGGGSDDVSSVNAESIVARGVITQLGSIWVTGCRYVAAPGGAYKIDDDDSASFDDYKVGQLVSIRGRKNDDGVSCIADEVEYEAEIEGVAKSGAINGVTIMITTSTNKEENTLLGPGDTLIDSNRYEVSGLWFDDTIIEATYIKNDDDGDFEDEIKGFVENDGLSSFDVRGITFNYTGTPDVVDGDFVEVHFDSCSGNAPDVICTASKVELEDDVFDQAEGMEAEIEGAVDLDTTGCPAAAEFKVDGVCIDSDSKPAQWMDGLTEFADLVQGARVEAEGHMVSSSPVDYLRADKVKGRGNRVRISSVAGNVNIGACTFTLIEGNISVTVLDCTNTFEGDTDSKDLLTIDNLAGEEVEVRGVRTNVPGEMMALRIKTDGLSSGSRHELRAEVDLDGVNKTDRQITVMGVVTQGIAGISGTELEVDDQAFPGTLDQFLELIDDNNVATDGPRDVVDVDFDINPGDGSNSSPYEAHQYEIEEEDD